MKPPKVELEPKEEGYDADGEQEAKDEFADDCFHMVTQYNWEKDIIWNGDDIKHKVRGDAG